MPCEADRQLRAGVAIIPQAVQQAKAASGNSLFKAAEKLGLKLEPQKAPVDLLVIDRVMKLAAAISFEDPEPSALCRFQSRSTRPLTRSIWMLRPIA